MAKYTEARKESNQRWDKENLETICLKLRKGIRGTWKEYADKEGLSVSKFVQAAVEEKAERDGLKTD